VQLPHGTPFQSLVSSVNQIPTTTRFEMHDPRRGQRRVFKRPTGGDVCGGLQGGRASRGPSRRKAPAHSNIGTSLSPSPKSHDLGSVQAESRG